MNSQKMIATGTYTSQQRFSARQSAVYQHVAVGFVTEVTPFETRVAMTPATVQEFILNGHKVFFQTGAGMHSGFEDQMYIQAGATLLQTAQEVYQKSQVMMKVMQPMPQEYAFIQPHQVIFCFWNSTNEKQFLESMMKQKAVIINYQSLRSELDSFPVMNAMSEITGFLAVQQGMKYMETQMGGRGKLMGQVSSVAAAHVLILGGGVAAIKAATFASSIGARVTLMDIGAENLRMITQQLPTTVNTMFYTTEALEQILPTVDLMIGAVMPQFYQAPVLVSERQMMMLQPGAVVIDLAMSQGRNFETSRLTTWEKPTFLWNKIVHFGVPSLAIYTPYTSSMALANVVMPYALQVANQGWKSAAVENFELRSALTVVENYMTNYDLYTQTQIPFTPVEKLLEQEIKEATRIEQTDSTTWSLKQQLTNLSTYRVQGKQTPFTIEA